jgi:hypothetical protein
MVTVGVEEAGRSMRVARCGISVGGTPAPRLGRLQAIETSKTTRVRKSLQQDFVVFRSFIAYNFTCSRFNRNYIYPLLVLF